ncbi:MAG: hypothetical protein LQ352_003768 [Teloschistes flavicans]|nr:MAG: hypothetical protein LQ352_003768 [Teloschistes flavicans]
MSSSSDPQHTLQNLSDEYQKLQTDLQPLITSLRRLESQSQENLSVQREFSTLSDDSKIYKLIGPVLLKQEKAEAESAVEGRLGWIEGEIKRVSSQIEDLQSKSEKKKMEVSLSILSSLKPTPYRPTAGKVHVD